MAFSEHGKIWMNGTLVPWTDANIHIASHVVHYGSAVFEGMRCYDTKRGSACFRIDSHMRRLYDSARIYRMTCPYEPDVLQAAVLETIRANAFKACYIRPIVYRGYNALGVNPTPCPVDVAILTWEWGPYLGEGALEHGVDVRVSSWSRVAPNTFPALAKTTANYASSGLIKMEAVADGYAEGIALDTSGYVSEGSGQNVFLVRDDVLYTPPMTASILPGITRDSVITLARDLGYRVEEQALPREMLYIAEEVFFVGTAVEVTPIRSIDRIPVGTGERGPVTEAIQRAFFDVINGDAPDSHGWLTFVDDTRARRVVAPTVARALTGPQVVMKLEELLRTAVAAEASDLHLKVGSYPMMRVNGVLVPASEAKRLGLEDTEAIASSIMTPVQQQKFREHYEVDLAHSVSGLGRFRCNVYRQRSTVGISIRVITTHIGTIEDLNLPAVLKRIAAEERGLVLVTGTTGCGKSTTLAAVIDYINRTRSCHIITVEDPIEHLHRDNRSIVSQREVAVDTDSFAAALRSALRQDPDVILVGEMRDLETVETGLLAAETGHLVLTTLHTLDATETINRIIAVFPPHQQRQVRLQLAAVLKAAISQRLIPRADGQGRVPAVEVMIATPFVRDCIVDKDRTHLIQGAIAAGTSQYGMQTFDQSILAHYRRGLITLDEALRWASNVDEFKLKVQGISTTADMARDEMAGGGGGRDGGDIPEITRFGG